MQRSDVSAFLSPWLVRWRLAPDGEPFTTRSSVLAPVMLAGAPAILKIARTDDERGGAALMEWYGGDGAARILAREGDALLLERACGPQSLALIAQGDDDRAMDILCAAAAKLHAERYAPPPNTLVPLQAWFRSLRMRAQSDGGVFLAAMGVAETLLANPREVIPLHGDIHHGNVLDGGARGWLAIDPKGLIGERAFDYCNLFCNPDAAIALKPGRLDRQLTRVARAAQLDELRLRKWVQAYAALSAAWMMEDGEDPSAELAITEYLGKYAAA